MPGERRPVGSPLLPARWRRFAAGVTAVCAAVTLLLGVIVHDTAAADGLDRRIDRWLRQGIGSHRGILNLLALPGSPMLAIVLAAVLVLVCLAARRWRAAALAAIAMPVASAVTEFILKPVVARKIGDSTGTFPSGHAVATFALAVTVCVVLAQPPPLLKPVPRRLLSLAALLAAAITSVAMVALHRHYFTDAIGGAAVGTAVVLLTAFGLDWLSARRPLRRPGTAGGQPQPHTAVHEELQPGTAGARAGGDPAATSVGPVHSPKPGGGQSPRS